MKISYNWIKRILPLEASVDELSGVLTQLGLEVEGVEKYVSIKGGLEGLVIGQVKSVVLHPNADRLRVCQVDVGEEILPIVCGAPNVAEGQKVAVATVGTTLYPSKGDSFKIKKSKIRGEVSIGMLCAEDEIGVGEGHDGILVLKTNLPNGSPLSEYFPIEKDTVFEIGLTPNRADAASHYGVARDLAVYYKQNLQKAEILLPQPEFEQYFDIQIEDPGKCPRYAGVLIEGVTVAPSPVWLQHHLKAIGIKPKNNIVDATNYILHGLGQPLHAFDAQKLTAGKVVVKTLSQNQKFTTLDGKSHEILAGEDLMICDGNTPVAIAGVMGGQNSEVTTETGSVFLEIAYFTPQTIRKTAKRLNISSDASYRYERGIDPNGTLYAARYAVQLITSLAGGKASAITDVQLKPFPPVSIELDWDNACKIMGFDFPRDEMKRILEALEIQVEESRGKYKLSVPPYRVDVTRPQDIMEELLRIYGYNNVPMPAKSSISLLPDKEVDPFLLRQKFCNHLASLGLREIMTNPLVPATEGEIEVAHPLSEDLKVLRNEMLTSGLRIIAFNQNRKQENLQFFEFAKTYHKHKKGYKEIPWVALYLCGQARPVSWKEKAAPETLHHLKGLVEQLAAYWNLPQYTFEVENQGNTWADQVGKFIINGKEVAQIGTVLPTMLKPHKIRGPVHFGLLNWDEWLKLYTPKVEFKELSRFPATSRDLSIVAKSHVKFAEIEAVIWKSKAQKWLKQVEVFDVYAGDKLEAGQKSYTCKLTFRSASHTLKDEVINQQMEALIESLEAVLPVLIRR